MNESALLILRMEEFFKGGVKYFVFGKMGGRPKKVGNHWFKLFENLNNDRYAELLTHRIIPAITEHFNPEELANIWFQQDGCPAHNARRVHEILRKTFDKRIISNRGPISGLPVPRIFRL